MKGNKGYIVVIVLLVVLLGLTGAYAVLGPNGFKTTETTKAFFDDTMNLQSTLSYYVGCSYSDAFGVYSKAEILSGKTEDGEKITDNENNILPELIYTNDTIDYKSDKAYKLNLEYVNTTLKVDMRKYEGNIEFYVVDGDVVKIKVISEPEWWNEAFDGLKI